MLIDNKEWISIKEFLAKYGIKRKSLDYRVQKKDWYDGFVLKRNKNTNRWLLACESDYIEWITSLTKEKGE